MANNTLATNIGQAANDFTDIKKALTEKEVPVPSGTKTEQYGDLIRSLYSKPYIDDIVEAARLTILKSNHEDFEIGPECSSFTGKIENGDNLFYNKTITRFSADLSKLKTGRNMLYWNPLTYFSSPMPELEDGTQMFLYTKTIGTNSIPGGLPKLKNGDIMFGSNPIDVFEYPSLESGIDMFKYMPELTVSQMVSILNSLPDRTGLNQATLTLGTSRRLLSAIQIAIGTNKNWNIAG